MTELRMGVIGLGMMGRNHVRVIRELSGTELTAVFDPLGDPHGAAPGVHTARDLDELLETIDAAVVAVPTEDHVGVGLRLAEAGVHALIEKPLAQSVSEARSLTEAFSSKALCLAVGHIERFNPAIRELKRRLAEDQVGTIHQIATSRQGPFPSRVKDVGVIKDLGTHDIDLTMYVSGATFTSVSAQISHKAGRPHEDLVAAVGRLSNGVVTNHLVNWLTPTKERHTIVTGDRGRFVADTISADLTFYANASVSSEWDAISRFRGVSEGDVIRYAIPKPEPLRVELENFRDRILLGAGEIITAEEGTAVLEVAEAVARSAESSSVELIQ